MELGEVGKVMGRPQQIVQVLVNLLVNAGQATASGGKVRVSTRREGDWVRVEVRDTGTGMAPGDACATSSSRSSPPSRPATGTGLGLAVAHGIITAHGGRIEVETSPGRARASPCTCRSCRGSHPEPRPGHLSTERGCACQGKR